MNLGAALPHRDKVKVLQRCKHLSEARAEHACVGVHEQRVAKGRVVHRDCLVHSPSFGWAQVLVKHVLVLLDLNDEAQIAWQAHLAARAWRIALHSDGQAHTRVLQAEQRLLHFVHARGVGCKQDAILPAHGVWCATATRLGQSSARHRKCAKRRNSDASRPAFF